MKTHQFFEVKVYFPSHFRVLSPYVSDAESPDVSSTIHGLVSANPRDPLEDQTNHLAGLARRLEDVQVGEGLHALLRRPDAPGDVLGWWINSVLEAASSPLPSIVSMSVYEESFWYVKLCRLCCERTHLQLPDWQVCSSALFLPFGSYSSTLHIASK